MESEKLQLTKYKRKGIYAYLCPVVLKGSTIERGAFFNGEPIEEGDNKERYYSGKSSKVYFDLGRFDDGLYEYKEANDHKARRGYLQIQSFQIESEWNDLQEMLAAIAPLPAELPQLEGTPRQIAWAESIREKAVRGGFRVEKAAKVTAAKLWIENRERFNNNAQ